MHFKQRYRLTHQQGKDDANMSSLILEADTQVFLKACYTFCRNQAACWQLSMQDFSTCSLWGKEFGQPTTWIRVESVQEIGWKQTNNSGPQLTKKGGENEIGEVGMTMGFAIYFYSNGKLLQD